jgi:hypothetical protein
VSERKDKAWTKERQAEYMRCYREKNRERIRQQQRENYLRNREVRLVEKREYYRANKGVHAERGKAWVKANEVKVRSYQADYRKQNHLRPRQYQQEYYRRHRQRRIRQQLARERADPNRRMAATLRKQLNRWVKKSSGRHSTKELLGCSFAEFRAWIESRFKRGMKWDNYGRVWHIDHVMPCCAFDLTRPEQVRVCFHFTNLQPMFARANLSKNRKITEPQLHLPL